MLPHFNYEVSFTIDNEHKVLSNDDDLNVVFYTNDLVKMEDTYFLTI